MLSNRVSHVTNMFHYRYDLKKLWPGSITVIKQRLPVIKKQGITLSYKTKSFYSFAYLSSQYGFSRQESNEIF